MAATLVQLKDAGPFPPVPLIAGTRHMTSDPADQQWLSAQQEFVKSSPLGREVRCARCGFAVRHDDPGLVIDPFRDMVGQARSRPQ